MRQRFILVLIMLSLALSACNKGRSTPGGSVLDSESKIGEQSTLSSDNANLTENAIIRAVAQKNCNYVYHMLAVSDCGYVNDYGSAYKPLHDDADLQILKNYEHYLTISGGEYEGDLYTMCVIIPASLEDDIPVDQYYLAIADLFETDDVRRNYEQYQAVYEHSFSSVVEVTLESCQGFYNSNEALKTEIAEIAGVMHRNYSIYADQVWDTTLPALSDAADKLNEEFATQQYESKWEELLGQPYGQDAFFALLCNSMENGPSAIDITAQKDVFYHSGKEDEPNLAHFISHEFGIYMLKDALSDTPAFEDYAYYDLVEGLAEYYNRIVCGGVKGWTAGTEYIDFYQQLNDEDPDITAKELFLHAVAFYMPVSG